MEQQVKNGRNGSGSQRYRCNVCNRRYTPEPGENGYPQATCEQTVRLYVDGLNFRRIARTLGVNHQSVINWVNAHAASLPDAPPMAESKPEVVELDDLFTFVGEKASGVRHHGGRPADALHCGLGAYDAGHASHTRPWDMGAPSVKP